MKKEYLSPQIHVEEMDVRESLLVESPTKTFSLTDENADPIESEDLVLD